MPKNRPIAHNARQNEIAKAAGEIIGSRGIRHTSMRGIAHQLDVTTGTIQHYFVNKDELLQYTARHLMDQLIDQAITKSKKTEGAGRLLVFCESVLPLTKESHGAWLVTISLIGATVGDRYLTELAIKRYTRMQEMFGAIIKQLQEDGVINQDIDPKLAGHGLVAFIEGLGMQIMFSTKRRATRYPKPLIAEYLHKMLSIDF